jgi:hypothetical protein
VAKRKVPKDARRLVTGGEKKKSEESEEGEKKRKTDFRFPFFSNLSKYEQESGQSQSFTE